MLKKLFILAIIVLLSVIVAIAQSQQSPPCAGVSDVQKNGKTVINKTTTQNDQRGTEQCPLIIKIIPSPNAQEEAIQAKKEKDERRDKERRSELTTNIIAIGTIIQALALIITIIVMVRTTRRQLRAYVLVSESSIYNVANPLLPLPTDYKKTGAEISRPTDGPIALMTIRNSGQTPAYEVISSGNICIREFPLSSNLPVETPPMFITKATIPSGGFTTKSIAMRPLTEDEITQLRNGTMAIYVYGKVTYKTFGKKKYSNYRVMHCSAAQIIGIGTGLTICEEGNEAN